MQRREALSLGFGALAARALGPRAALAQSKYPERPIRLVIPFTPGGVNDAIGRPWAFIASGFEPHIDSSPDKARRFVDGEIARWTPIIKAIGLKLE